MSITIIETQRINLALLVPDDQPLLAQYYAINKEHLAPWEPLREPEYFSEAETLLRIKSALLAFKQQSAFHFTLLNKNNDEVLGVCNFSNVARGPLQACHLGYAISIKHQGKGLMQEALLAATDYTFNTLKLHRIMANYIPENIRSAKVLEKIGFKKEGYSPSYLKIAGKWQDHVLTALINPADIKDD